MGTFNNITSELESISFVVSKIPKYEAWDIPKGYFDRILPAVLKSIKTENINTPARTNETFLELEAISPLLASISKENVFTIPTNYFTTYKPNTNKEEAKIVPITTKKTINYTWVVAASITLLIGLSLFWITQHFKKNESNAMNMWVETIDRIDEKYLITYIDNNRPLMDPFVMNTKLNWDISTQINSIDEKEIRQYILENDYLM